MYFYGEKSSTRMVFFVFGLMYHTVMFSLILIFVCIHQLLYISGILVHLPLLLMYSMCHRIYFFNHIPLLYPSIHRSNFVIAHEPASVHWLWGQCMAPDEI
jgi:hypothetical protein